MSAGTFNPGLRQHPGFFMRLSMTNLTSTKCPHCGTRALWQDNPFRPFCSERCQLVDLGAWVNGEYCIPGREAIPEEDEDLQ
jgi:endogenous inhibitor of DNA gyrase (YacG/DUF329 family)